MRPSQVAQALRQIASKIDKSKIPDRNLVTKDLKFLLNRIASGDFSGNTIKIAERLTSYLNSKGLNAVHSTETWDELHFVEVNGWTVSVSGEDWTESPPGAAISINGSVVEPTVSSFEEIYNIVKNPASLDSY